MFYHRGSWISEKGIKSASDLFRPNDSNYGTTTMSGQKTSSWQKFYPHEEQRYGYGYDCSQFARDAADKEKGRKPVIVEFQIPDKETYNKYSQYLKLVLKRGHESDITLNQSLVTVLATLVNASRFSYEEFLKYRGELLIDHKISESGTKIVEDLHLMIYETGYVRYDEFVQKYNEGKIKPLYTTEDILRELSPKSPEGNEESIR